MDKNYYYRILGLRSDASPTDIRKAYNSRMAKLSLPDYNDDPEYAHRKKQQATMAYRVLMGSAPVPTKQHREKKFENFKDSIEEREGAEEKGVEDIKAALSDVLNKVRESIPAKGKSGKKAMSSESKGKAAAWAVSIVLIVIMLFSTALDSSDNSVDWNTIGEEAEYAYDQMWDVDYREHIDMTTMTGNYEQGNVVSNQGEGLYGEGEVYEATLDLLYALDIYDHEGFFAYITDDEDFYYENDDLACAQEVINWINAPSFALVAGGTSEFTDEPILDMEDYLRYLEEIAYYEI